MLAVQVSPDSEMEAIKAQAVIARTYIRQQMENGSEKPEIGMSETGGEVTTVGKSQSVLVLKKHRTQLTIMLSKHRLRVQSLM